MSELAILSMDGNCGCALLGGNLQDGEAEFVISSINSGKQHKVELEDDVAYWQRGEWCEWAKNDVLPKIEAALANYRKGVE